MSCLSFPICAFTNNSPSPPNIHPGSTRLHSQGRRHTKIVTRPGEVVLQPVLTNSFLGDKLTIEVTSQGVGFHSGFSDALNPGPQPQFILC